jgi:hypothetical protein
MVLAHDATPILIFQSDAQALGNTAAAAAVPL